MKMIKVLAERLNRKVAPMHTVPYNASITKVAAFFVEKNIGAALVEKEVHEDGMFAGIISEKDIIKCCAEHSDLNKLPVHKIMQSEMITANIHDEVKPTVRKMRENHIRHIPLIEHAAMGDNMLAHFQGHGPDAAGEPGTEGLPIGGGGDVLAHLRGNARDQRGAVVQRVNVIDGDADGLISKMLLLDGQLLG